MVNSHFPSAWRMLSLPALLLFVLGTSSASSSEGPHESRTAQPEHESDAVRIEPKLQSLIEGRKVLSIVHAVVAPSRTETRHTHPGLEVIYVLEGSGRIDINGKTSDLKKGTIVQVPAGATKAMTNGSRTEPLKVLAVLVLEPEAPPVSMID
jgi:quercetin dioxygenase-like cupin family protein